MAADGRLFHRAVGEGVSYWGPGDRYTFLVTGAESGGAYFAMEAVVPAGGGPPWHTHAREHETFYVLDGTCTPRHDFLAAGQQHPWPLTAAAVDSHRRRR